MVSRVCVFKESYQRESKVDALFYYGVILNQEWLLGQLALIDF